MPQYCAPSEVSPALPWCDRTSRSEWPTLLPSFGCAGVLARSNNLTGYSPPERSWEHYRCANLVMEHVAAIAHGKSFVEIGSSRGDLIECVSHVSASAHALEIVPSDCAVLTQRSARSSGRWSFDGCGAFPNAATPDAQVYFMWMPFQYNLPLLRAFRSMQDKGAIRKDALLVAGFSGREQVRRGKTEEHNCFTRGLRPFAKHFADVHFREGSAPRQSGVSHLAVFEPWALGDELERATNRTRCCVRQKEPCCVCRYAGPADRNAP